MSYTLQHTHDALVSADLARPGIQVEYLYLRQTRLCKAEDTFATNAAYTTAKNR